MPLHTHSEHHFNDNNHIPVEMVGWCNNISQGEHTLSAVVSQREGHADCYTGWQTSEYMEIWEPSPEERALTTVMQLEKNAGNNGAESGTIRTMTFNKKHADSNVRILYVDNFRVIGNGAWCRWEVKVDGQSCPAPLATTVHTVNGENDHHPGTVVGTCPGLAAGDHTVTVVLNSSGADCYTGWDTTAVIEVQELP